MWFRTEHQRNMAFDLLRLKRKNIPIRSFFKKKEPVIIYGLDFLGKEIYCELKEWAHVLCFIDRSHDGKRFDGVRIFCLDNKELDKIVALYEKIKVLIMIQPEWMLISGMITDRFSNVVPLSLYEVTSYIKMREPVFFSHKQQKALEIVRNILDNRPAGIRRIVLTGTSYTELLSFLILPDWQHCLYVAERFLQPGSVKNMTDAHIACLYEEEAGEFYDICYLIAAYAKKYHIPVYGHDHMLLSRPFLENGIVVVEDGNANYDVKYAVANESVLDDGKRYQPYGFDQHVQKVFLTGLMEIPQELEQKAVCINPYQCWCTKTEEEKQMITSIFSFPYDKISTLIRQGKNILFLTEPYAYMDSGKIITVQQQVEMYREVLACYDKDSVLIKPHPADKTDYAVRMPDYTVIDREFPIQLLMWTGLEIKKVIMFWDTTCMYSVSNICETDVYKDILFRYGLLR